MNKTENCRLCGCPSFYSRLNLDNPYISDFVDKIDRKAPRAPLRLIECTKCGLVQLDYTVDRGQLYQRYWYKSGLNESMVRSLRDVVQDALTHVVLQPGDSVLDIGANDGTLLKQYGPEVKRYAVEPSDTFAQDLKWMRPGDRYWHTYWPLPDWSDRMSCKIITSIAVFYDVDNLDGFVAAIKRCLHPEGVWIVQMMDLGEMVEHNAFDNICHEHLVYFSRGSMEYLLARHELAIKSVSHNDVNGGSVRYIIGHAPEETVATPLAQQYDLGAFGERVLQRRDDTLALLWELKESGAKVLGYGASTKGNTLLQMYGIGPELLPAIAERNPDKWGKFTVGSWIPIISEEEMRARKPDFLFVLPYHFIDGFKKRESVLLAAGTQFILPLPEVRIIGGDNASLQSKVPAAAVGEAVGR